MNLRTTPRSAARTTLRALPLIVSSTLVLAACGGDGNSAAVSAPAPAAVQEAPAAPAPAPAADLAQPAGKAAAEAPAKLARPAKSAASAPKTGAAKPAAAAPAAKSASGNARAKPATAQAKSAETLGASDVGVTRESIKLGIVNMHGMALGNILIQPQVAGMQATASALNDRGGVLGRRLSIVDCDDGPGEVSRAKSCIKKLVGQDQIFSLLTSVTWSTASLHDDLKINKLPLVGAWAYSQTEWEDPYMFPTHMSMLHEALANAHWVKDVVKPKTYGLLCLTSPEMQKACANVSSVLDNAGIKLVKKVDVSISEASMSSAILAMRAANPDHIVHYVINAATVGKFMIEAAQQNYYPPMGISGNHLAAEVLGGLIGKHPVNRYWINTTYKLWGPEYMATMARYARGNRGKNHHILQAGYVGLNIFAQAAKEVGPDLTREKLMAVLASDRVWKSDVSLDQRFSWRPAERGDDYRAELGNGREFMYEYSSSNTAANPDGSPSGFTPAKDGFVIHARG